MDSWTPEERQVWLIEAYQRLRRNAVRDKEISDRAIARLTDNHNQALTRIMELEGEVMMMRATVQALDNAVDPFRVDRRV
jgi:hypothetical protein